jgi:serine/threonine protein kinase
MPETIRKLGPYKLISKIGNGAFGVVWLAEKQTSIATTRVALKLARDQDVDLEAFRQEAAIWIQASGHPNVLTMIDADIYDEQVAIVSEYVRDGSLAGWLKRSGGKAPSIEAACQIIDGTLAGLAHLHERRIIHRDLKPDNILLQRDTPRLADFGISRLLRTGSYSTNISGTLAYMAPEAFDGKRNQQTDIWAVGVIFYQLLAGRLPYVQPDMVSLIGALMRDDAPPLPETVPQVLGQIVMKALHRDPSRRYLSAEEMRQDLCEAEHQLWLAQREAPTITDNDKETTQEQPKPMVAPAARSNAKWLVTVLAALVLLAVGGSIVVVKIVNSALSPANANQNQAAGTTTSNNLNTAAAPSLDPAPSPTPDEAQLLQATDRYLAGVAKALSGNEEDKSLRKVIRGDIDGDGDTDVVVQFVLIPNAGNSAAVMIAVFINDDGKFKGVTDKVVGGNHLRDFEMESVQPGRVVAVTLECPGDEYPCENSMKRQAIIFWKNNKLIAPDRWIE